MVFLSLSNNCIVSCMGFYTKSRPLYILISFQVLK
ncbi:hypothetical protein Alsa1_CDS0223 [Staphylococcus phage Alsa_1]|nr:hypothetical protein Alsa1_CDS0223 [Staphylococcus phage Alsa_1]